MKKCTWCLEEKNEKEFYQRSKPPHYLHSQCKKCELERARLSPKAREKSFKERDERMRKLGLQKNKWSEWHKERIAQGQANLHTQESRNESQAKVVWRSYKSRGFKGTLDQLKEVTQKDCFYCGCAPSQVKKSAYDKRTKYVSLQGKYIYNGIDRMDNTKGYIEGNMVPCCDMCNKAKRNLKLEIFLNWLQRIKNRR